MPTYEYRCMACGHEFERFQKMSDRPVRTCPECRKRKVERRISSGGGIVFKGAGFYATDYRKDAPPAKESAESSGSGKKEPGSGTEGGGGKGKGEGGKGDAS